MNIQQLTKYKPLFISAVLTVILVLVGLFMVFKLRAEFEKVKKDLTGKEQALARLNQRAPFPSQENLEVVKANLEKVSAGLTDVQNRLMTNQIAPLAVERAAFPTQLENGMRNLRHAAETNNVIVDPLFAFGFDRYSEGGLPTSEHMPRLTVQLQMIREISNIMFASGITSLDVIERDVFEEANELDEEFVDPRRSSRSSRKTKKTPLKREPSLAETLYDAEQFAFTFTTDSRGLWNAMNKLAGSELFIVVTQADLRNDSMPTAMKPKKPSALRPAATRPGAFFETEALGAGAELAFPGTGAGQPEDPGADLRGMSHEERVVAGREPLKATLTLKVFRFKGNSPEEEEEEEDGR